MASNGKDINIVFTPQIGLGDILFTYDREDVIKVLGLPEEEENDMFNENESVIYMYYEHIRIGLYYENNVHDYLIASSNDIILDGFQFSLFSKKEVLEFIEQYHHKNNIEYLHEMEQDDEMGEEYYDFENIGLTIWYEGELISDISVMMPCLEEE